MRAQRLSSSSSSSLMAPTAPRHREIFVIQRFIKYVQRMTITALIIINILQEIVIDLAVAGLYVSISSIYHLTQAICLGLRHKANIKVLGKIIEWQMKNFKEFNTSFVISTCIPVFRPHSWIVVRILLLCVFITRWQHRIDDNVFFIDVYIVCINFGKLK